jgi:type I restriction enzyme S subunit
VSLDLPSSWTRTTIGEVTAGVQQRQPQPEEEILYIDISSVDRETKDIRTPQRLRGAKAPSRARQVVAVNDVLVSMTRPNLNAVAIVPPEMDGEIASTGFDVLRSVAIDARWLFYIVRSSEFISAMSNLVQGALYPAVRPKDIRGFEISLAPLNEQKRIADKLDTLLARVDACRERLDRVPTVLKRFRQAVLAAATSGQLTEEWRQANPGLVDVNDLVAQIHEVHEAAGGHKAGNAAPPTDDVHDLSVAQIHG